MLGSALRLPLLKMHHAFLDLDLKTIKAGPEGQLSWPLNFPSSYLAHSRIRRLFFWNHDIELATQAAVDSHVRSHSV